MSPAENRPRGAGAIDQVFTTSRNLSQSQDPIDPPVVTARGYAAHYLRNAVAFWGVAGGLSAAAIALVFLSRFWTDIARREYVLAAAVAVLAVAIFRGVRALLDLLDKPVSIQGKISEKSASLYLNRLVFLEDKYRLRIVRGDDHRPIAYGTGLALAEGWFLAGKGYHDIVAEGSLVQCSVHRRTRVIASLVKL